MTNYNISFDVAALIVSLIIYIIHYNFYNNDGNNSVFRLFTIFVAINCIMDVLSAWGIQQFFTISDFPNTLLNTAFLISMLLADYYAYHAVAVSLKYRSLIFFRINHFIFLAGILALIINIFTGFQFSFNNYTYSTTAWFFMNHAICGWFMLCIIIVIINKRETLAPSRFHIAIAGIVAILIPVILQIQFPNLLLIPLGTASIAFVLLFTLETPDYQKLQAAKLALEEARADEIARRKELEKSNADKTVFLENMSHELRTPINAILGFNKMIQLEDISEETLQKSQSIQVAGNSLLKLVGDILDFSQIETSRLEIKPEEYETIELYIYNIGAEENHLDSSIPHRLYGDINRIRQILSNLYMFGKDNAPKSHVSFKLNSLGVNDDTVRLKFTYKMSELSISEEEIEKVQKGSFSEHLLPLAIAYKILSNMDSELKIFSGKDAGTVFTFELSQRIIDIKETGELNEAWLKYERHHISATDELDFIIPKAKILAVDDVKLNLKVLSGLLRKFQIQPATATSGADAIKYMEKNEVDLVFMDIMMPEMDGVEALHAIKNNPNIVSPNATIIALTANVTVGAKELYLSEGFDGYLSKPISIPKIGLTLRHFLDDKVEDDWEEVIGIDADGNAL